MILTVYGIIVFIKGPKRDPSKTDDVLKSGSDYLMLFIKGFFLNFINVGVLVFWLGVIIIAGPGFDNDPNRFLAFFGTMIGAYLVTDILKILLAKQLKKRLTSDIIIRIKKVLGLVLIVCGIVLIVKGFLPKDKLNPQDLIEDIRE